MADQQEAMYYLSCDAPNAKGTPLFDVEYLRNSTKYVHSYNGILMGLYIRPAQWCMTLSN